MVQVKLRGLCTALCRLLLAIQGLLTALRQLGRPATQRQLLPAQTCARCGCSHPQEMLDTPPASRVGPHCGHSCQPLVAHASRHDRSAAKFLSGASVGKAAFSQGGQSFSSAFAEAGSCAPVLGQGERGLLPAGKRGCCGWGSEHGPGASPWGRHTCKHSPCGQGEPQLCGSQQQDLARWASPAAAPAGAAHCSVAGARLALQPPLASRPSSCCSPPY